MYVSEGQSSDLYDQYFNGRVKLTRRNMSRLLNYNTRFSICIETNKGIDLRVVTLISLRPI
jgi:hypothetical protein